MGKHLHHIIPKHAGGTDDPSNLIELTIEEHAEAHRELFEQYNRWQDYIAWKALSGQITSDEIRKELSRLAWFGKKHTVESIDKIKQARSRQKFSTETRLKMSASRKGKVPEAALKNAHTKAANKKRSKKMQGIPKEVIKCPHCGKHGGKPQMHQWHFDNCKELKCE